MSENLPATTKPYGLPQAVIDRRQRLRSEEICVHHIERFLQLLAESGRPLAAAEGAGLSLYTIKRLRKDDGDFDEMCMEAQQKFSESLEEECYNRAVVGWDEPVFSQKTGDHIGDIHRKDSRLLELMLKKNIREYRDRVEGEIKVTGGVLVAPMAMPTEEDWGKRFEGQKVDIVEQRQEPIVTPASAPPA